MKTVFMFNQYASYPGIPGSTRHFNLARELVRNGMNVYIFSSNFNHMAKSNYGNTRGLYSMEKVEGVHYVRMNTFHYYNNNWRRLFNMLDYGVKSYRISLALAGQGIRPNVIIGTVAHPFSVASAHYVCKRLRARFFIDIGDLWPEVFVTSGKMSKRNPVYFSVKNIMFHFYKRAERIMCLTEETMNYFKNSGFGEKTVLLPPGIELNNGVFANPASERTEEFKVIYAGSFQPIYPIENIIKAAKLMENTGDGIRFVLIGGGVQKRAMMSLAQELDVHNVEFLDPMPKKSLLEFLGQASALILIEKKASYGFPNKIIDYLIAGKPIIYASPVRHEVLNSGCCIEASCNDPRSIADAVVKVSGMPDYKLAEITSAAREYLHEHHNIQTLAERLIEHLN